LFFLPAALRLSRQRGRAFTAKFSRIHQRRFNHESKKSSARIAVGSYDHRQPNLDEHRPSASQYKVLHYFGNRPARTPGGGLVPDSAGNLYGTTVFSRPDSCGSTGCCVVFKLTRKSGGAWSYSVIYRFNGPDGQKPIGRLILDSSGNLYGTTYYGGAHGQGTVFELSPSGGTWNESVLANLGATTEDVANPIGGLTLDASGNLYGTTENGGTSSLGGVFEVARSGNQWNKKVIYSFNLTDGGYPSNVELVWDLAGNLYGTTVEGGQFDQGVVFELSPSSGGTWTETVLYSFTGGTDGGNLQNGVVFNGSGNLYGTTFYGGDGNACNGGCGTVFQLTPSSGQWVFSVAFTFGGANGSNPYAPLTSDSAGNLMEPLFMVAEVMGSFSS
jgi:uncharacterized repeat protein (TIGR03803 family)